jgi:hypothetical protein
MNEFMSWIIGIFISFFFLCGLVGSIIIYEETHPKTIVYWDHNNDSDDFRGGIAWWVLPDINRPADEHFGEFMISKSLYEALFSLSIIYSFNKLSHDFILGEYEEGILIGSGVVEAAEILRKKAGSLSQLFYDWHCSEQIKPERIAYRIKVDANDLRRELFALADFMSEAALKNYAVELWL